MAGLLVQEFSLEEIKEAIFAMGDRPEWSFHGFLP